MKHDLLLVCVVAYCKINTEKAILFLILPNLLHMEDLENQPTNFKFSYTDFKTFLRLIDVT